MQPNSFIKTFVFASSGDDARLYFDLTGLSIWEYWMDDGSIRQVYGNFEDLLLNAKFIEQE